ncbi:unnamed protein product [Nyctereutes procyonoides]|uniref:(raccoon dog) hypothetical protein n=1 Tax=Nyctereutes procyonoides TaxID=34880 RepID=A0A811YP85_NYCPR|nr:unnamed protein product [Nyctereutes procyonoides]
MVYLGRSGAISTYYPGRYGGALGGPTFSRQTQDLLYSYFAAGAVQDGQAETDELQRCLTPEGYKPFNLETCWLMISMLGTDMSGTMGFNEFKELWAVLKGWTQHFISFDRDWSGTVDPQELQRALTTMGFRSDSFQRWDTAQQGAVNFPYDDFIQCVFKPRGG